MNPTQTLEGMTFGQALETIMKHADPATSPGDELEVKLSFAKMIKESKQGNQDAQDVINVIKNIADRNREVS